MSLLHYFTHSQLVCQNLLRTFSPQDMDLPSPLVFGSFTLITTLYALSDPTFCHCAAHGLGLHGDVLFVVNHAFRGGGERVERWRVEVLPDNDDSPPVKLTHLGSILGHDGDDAGEGAWSFTSRLNGAINGIAPVGPHEFFMTQFLDAPASLEGAGSGSLEGYVSDNEGWLARTFRAAASLFNATLYAKIFIRSLRHSRVWHCFCAETSMPSIDAEEGEEPRCERTQCDAVGPNSTCWNGIAYRAVEKNVDGVSGYLVCSSHSYERPPSNEILVACVRTHSHLMRYDPS